MALATEDRGSAMFSEPNSRKLQTTSPYGGYTAAEEDEAELVLAKGSREQELLALMDGLRRVSGVREVDSAMMNGSSESKPQQ